MGKTPQEKVQEARVLLERNKDTTKFAAWNKAIQDKVNEVVAEITEGAFETLASLTEASNKAGKLPIPMHFVTAAINEGDGELASEILAYNLAIRSQK